MNFRYLAIKLPNFKPIDEELTELEPRVSRSFDIKIVSRKKAFESFPSNPLLVKLFCFKISFCIGDITIFFFADLKLYLWSTHMANNLILAISFGFKLNSNLKRRCLPSLSVRDRQLDKTLWQLLTSPKSLSREAMETAVILTNDRFSERKKSTALLPP